MVRELGVYVWWGDEIWVGVRVVGEEGVGERCGLGVVGGGGLGGM